jgi:hypothetical protein
MQGVVLILSGRPCAGVAAQATHDMLLLFRRNCVWNSFIYLCGSAGWSKTKGRLQGLEPPLKEETELNWKAVYHHDLPHARTTP